MQQAKIQDVIAKSNTSTNIFFSTMLRYNGIYGNKIPFLDIVPV